MIDDLLRTAVRDLADESGTPHDLAAAALARGHRIRRNRRAATAAAALAVVLAATVPFVIRRTPADEPRPLPAATVTTAPAREFDERETFTGPGGAHLLAVIDRATVRVLDAKNGGYRQLPTAVANAEPSPDGRYAAVHRYDDTNVRILDLTTGDYWRPPVPVPSFAMWSEDGRLLLTHDDGYSILEPGTRRRSTVTVDPQQMRCIDFCRFTWSALDTRVVLPQASARGEEDARVGGLAVFEPDSGELLRNVPIKGDPVGQSSWSPDGRRVLVHPGVSRDQVSIVEVETRREVAHFTASWSRYLADGTVLAQLGRVLTRYDANGVVLEKVAVPAGLLGRGLTFGS
ncbi:hypothetical protein [Actinoplanes sp. NPDC023714]|uniref:WD40 repeat domain-containing protein n=1 Tax=Actinoplanes sp. NPDC023714 TaxID=3154322 RepID=UPI0033C53D85